VDGMSDDAVEKAEQAVRAAETDTEMVRLVAAVLAAQAATAQQACQPTGCQHQHPPARQFDTKKWLVIGGTVCVCSLAFALASIAIAIGATCATACLLILRNLWNDIQKGK
jgi:hypothetical protein